MVHVSVPPLSPALTQQVLFLFLFLYPAGMTQSPVCYLSCPWSKAEEEVVSGVHLSGSQDVRSVGLYTQLGSIAAATVFQSLPQAPLWMPSTAVDTICGICFTPLFILM